MEYIGWIGSILLILGMVLVGGKHRIGFLIGFLGELLWVVKSFNTGQLDLLIICVLFCVIYVSNWFRWKNEIYVAS